MTKRYILILILWALALALLLILTGPVRDAHAARHHHRAEAFPYTTVHALQIAERAWGPCDGPVTIKRLPNNAWEFSGGPSGFVFMSAGQWNADGTELINVCADGDPTDNTINFPLKPITNEWPDYCTGIVHETGHLHGVGHASPTSISVMAPNLGYIWKYCLPQRLWRSWRGSYTTDRSVPGIPDRTIPQPDPAR